MLIDRAGRIRIVGCGRWFRRDDQVGLLVVQALKAMGTHSTAIEMTEAPGAELADQFEDCDALVLVDAAAADDAHPPGSWQAIDYVRHPERLRSGREDNTHTIGVANALRLAGTLGALPASVTIYAIAVADTRQGDELTPSVAAAVPHVAASIAAMLPVDADPSHVRGACRA